MKTYEVSFSQTVIRQWSVTLEAENADEALKKAVDGEYDYGAEFLVDESDQGTGDFVVNEQKDSLPIK